MHVVYLLTQDRADEMVVIFFATVVLSLVAIGIYLGLNKVWRKWNNLR